MMNRKALIPVLATISTILLSGQPASTLVRPLVKAAAGSLAAGQTDRYSIAVPPSSFLRLAVDVFQSPLRFVLRDPRQKALKELAPVPGIFGAFELVATIESGGAYTLEVSNSSGHTGVYELEMIELNPAGAHAQEYERANDRLIRVFDPVASAPRADPSLSRAVAQADQACEGLDDVRCKMRAGFVKGLLLERMNRFPDARVEFEKATQSAASAGETHLEGASTDQLVLVLSKLGDFRTGTEMARKALDTSGRAGSVFLTANAHSRLCGMLEQGGKMDEALEECRTATRLADGNHLMAVSGEAGVRIAEMLNLRGDKDAEAVANSALQAFREGQNQEGQAYALQILAGIRLNHGDFQGALDYENQASPLYAGDPHGQANNLRSLGTAYARLGQLKLAESHYEKAAELSHSVGDQAGEAETLLAFGLTKQRQKDIQGSLELYHKALDLSRAISLRPDEAQALYYIGRALSDSRDFDGATQSYRQALAIYREMNDLSQEGQILGTLGGLARSKADYTTALEYYRQTLAVKQRAGDQFGIAISKMTIGAALRSQGKLEEARASLAEAVRDIEAQRAQVKSPNLRMTYFDGVQRFYEEDIDLLMEMHRKKPDAGYDREAFQVSESARARVLLDNMPGLQDVIPPEFAERERQLRTQIDAATKNPKIPRTDLDLLQAQYERLYDEARSRSPWYAAGDRAPVLSVNEAAQRLLDERTLLVEYKVGTSRSFVWVISRNGVYTQQLAGKAKLRKLVADVQTAQKLQTVDADESFWKAAQALSRELIAPIADQLVTERVLLVTDDVLQEVPFAGLPWPDDSPGAPPSPLVKHIETIHIPSASAAAAIRAVSHPRAGFAKDISVFADPVFAERIRVRVTGDSAEAIRRIIPPNKIGVFTGLNASLEKLKSAHLEDYRVIYFATHADIDADRPETSGIRLSNVDAQGRPQPDRLRILDIYQLHMHPDLVVLGDCNSAEGTNRAGEGLVTFARAFLFAGARRVIATLWPVEPVPAMGLTTPMLSRLLGSQRMNPSAALRQTQLSLWNTGISPRQWSAFIMIGDWD